MKNLKLTLILICSLLFANSNLQAQAPEKINYQAVARNLAGNPLVNQAVGLEFNIRQGSPTGSVVYSETHTGVSTNQFGLFTAEIGGGTVNSGVFSAINWGLSSFYLQVTIDGNILPATQLLSVPFALYAKESANGPAGASGHNSLMNSTPEPAGTNCTNGGYFIQTWLDLDDDGTLSTGETPISYYVCNGADGAVGPQGPAGINGTTYFAGNGISLSGDTITNIGDADNNPTNELQTLSLQNDSLFLSNGNYVVLPSSSSGFWSTFGGLNIHNNNPGNVGIGTNTPIHQLSVASNDSVVASFLGTDPNVAAIVVGNINANAATGIVFFNGTDTTSYIFLTPTTNSLTIRNNSINGNILISTDSVIVNQGLILANQAQYSIYNQTDTIYNYSSSGKIINVNQGMFLTDSLYVLGSNATNTNWILANDGLGQAKWTDPSTIVGSVGDNWGSQFVFTDTTLIGIGIVGTPLSVNPNIIPTQTSQLTNNSGFITSPNDGDTSATNELQVLSFANDTLYLSNGNAIYLPPSTGDSWGLQTVVTDTSLFGDGAGTPLSVNPNIIPANISAFTNDVPYLTTFTEADADTTNELQTLSFVDPILTLSKGGGTVNLSTLSGTTYTAGTGINLTGDTITNTAPDQTVTITGFGSTTVGGPYPNFSITSTDNQTLTATPSPGSILLDISGGNSVTLGINDADASPANELITSFAVNGTSDSLVIMEGINNYKAVPLTSLAAAGKWTENAGNLYPTTLTNNIGIGTNSPIGKLEVAGGSIILRDATDVVDAIELTAGTGASASGSLVLKNSGVNTVNLSGIGTSWLNAGNVGIGTTTPNGNLHIFGTNPRLYIQDSQTTSAAYPSLELGNTFLGAFNPLASISIPGSGNYLQIAANDAIFFNTNFTDRMIITNSGNIGIGTTGPTSRFHLEGSLRLNNLSGTAPAIGSVLTSIDAAGNAEWAPPSGAANAWNLTGNAGTNATTNFIGTTDNVALNFRVNNTKAGKIDSTNNEVAFGYNALLSNTSGAQITAIGTNALKQHTTGTENTAVGYNALENVTTAYGNTAIGSRALSSVTTNGNSAVGYGALELNSVGSNNTAMGMFSLRSSTSGFNAAFGYYSLAFNTSGGNNTAMGYNVLGSNTTGSSNTAVGYNSGIGNVSGASNTLIGANADVSANNLTNATAIGANAIVSQSNSLILGNNANVGIGTNSPLFPLEIITSTQLRGVQIQNTFPSANPKYGIYAVASGTGAGDNIGGWFDATGTTNINYGVGAQAIGVAGTGENRAIYGNASSGSINWAGYFDNGNVYIKNYLGIGTTAPGFPLDVKTSTALRSAYFETNTNSASNTFGVYSIVQGAGTGAKRAGSFEAYNGSGENVGVRGYATGSTATNYGIYGWSNGAGGTNVGVSGTASGATNNYGGYFTASGASSYALVVPNGGGNVGIGTITPTAKLDVNGTILISGPNANELNRAQTGAANLVPIAYGSVGSGAAVTNPGTGNWSVVAGGAGQYTITVVGETFVANSHIMTGTMNGSYGFISLIAFSNNILVQTTNTGGANQNAAFSFVVYKP